MELGDFLVALGGISISVMGYFLRETLNDLKSVKEVAYSNKNKIELLEKEYMLRIERLNEKIALLYDAIDKLNDNISRLSEKIK
jgi:hypothetical protein